VLKKFLEDKEDADMSTIKIKQIKSRIGAPADQKRTLDALGLRKLNRVVEHEYTPSILGMVTKVKHLVTIVE
jgi:large subunit ribosomal protein L30